MLEREMNGTEHAGAVPGEILTEEEMTAGASRSVSQDAGTSSGKKRTVTGARTLRRSESRRSGVLTREQAVRKVQEAAVASGSYRSGSRYEDKQPEPAVIRTGSRYMDEQPGHVSESFLKRFAENLKRKDAKAVAAVSAAASFSGSETSPSAAVLMSSVFSIASVFSVLTSCMSP